MKRWSAWEPITLPFPTSDPRYGPCVQHPSVPHRTPLGSTALGWGGTGVLRLPSPTPAHGLPQSTLGIRGHGGQRPDLVPFDGAPASEKGSTQA